MQRRTSNQIIQLRQRPSASVRLACAALLGVALCWLPGRSDAQVSIGSAQTELQFNDTTSFDPEQFTVAMNSQGYVGLAFHDGIGEDLWYIEQTGSGWQSQVLIDSSGDVGKNLTLIFDENDHPHVSFRRDDDNEANRRPRYARRLSTNATGSWSSPENADTAPARGNFIKMDLDSSIQPHIIYRDEGVNNEGWYAYRSGGGTWTQERVVNTDRTRHFIAVDQFDVPHVVWNDHNNGRFYYTYRQGTNNWANEVLIDSGTNPGQGTSMALIDGDPDRIGVAYGHHGANRLRYATNSGGWSWENVKTTTSGRDARHSRLVYDAFDVPHIVHREDDDARTNNYIGYNEKLSGSWSNYTVDQGGVGGGFLLMDADGKMTIFYSKLTGSTAKRIYSRRVYIAPLCDTGGPYSGTAGVPVDFDASASFDYDGTIVAYDWEFGDGQVGGGAMTSNTYAGGGTYTVTLTVEDDDGRFSSCTTSCTIGGGNTPPVCDAGGPYGGTAGSPVAFDGSGSFDPDGSISSYSWNFGDGNMGSGSAPSHTYASAGAYVVTLCVTDNGGATSCCTVAITIDPALVPPFCDAGGPYGGTAGQSIGFDGSGSSDSDGSIVSYSWSFGDGASAGGVSPSHVYGSAGTYTVTLCVTDDDFQQSCCATTATVAAAPQPPFCDAGGPYSGVTGELIPFDGTGSADPDGSIVTFAWEYGDGNTANGSQTLHTYTSPGTYTVTLCVTDDDAQQSCCTTTATITAAPQPPSCDAGGPYGADAGVQIDFDGTGSSDPDGTITAYDWDFGDGNVGSGVQPSHVYAAIGTYTVTLCVTDDDAQQSCCTASVVISNAPQPPVCEAGGPYTGVAGESLDFDGSGSGDVDGTITAYAWEFGDGQSGSGEQTTHTYTTAGTYTVTLCVTDDDAQESCCTTTATIAQGNQAPLCDAGSPQSGSVGESLTFDGSGSSDDGTIVAYAWQFGDGNTGSGISLLHVYGTHGTFTVTLTVTDDDGVSSSCTTTAIINALPVCDADGTYSGTPGETIIFDGTGSSDVDGSIVDYAWQFGDGGTAQGVMPSHVYTAAGNYTVTLCVTDDDGAVSCCETMANIDAVNPPPTCDAGGPYSAQVGESISFNGTSSSDNGSIVSFVWNFGDGRASNGAVVSHTYEAVDVYTVTLCVTDDEGAEVCCSTTVTIGEVPPVVPIESVELDDSGVAPSMQVTTSADVTSVSGMYRLGGESDFRPITDFFSVPDGDGLVWSSQFDAAEMTTRGVEYFLTYEIGGQQFTFGSNANPERLTIEATEPCADLIDRAYRMLALPADLPQPTPITGVLQPIFGEPGDFTWRAARWNPAAERYDAVAGSSTTEFQMGEAYWFVTDDPVAWQLTGRSRFPDPASGMFEVTLEPGWNMVGNPTSYRMTLDESQLMIRDGAATQSFQDAANADPALVALNIFVYDARINGPNKYFEPPFLAKWNGCWMRNLTNRQLTLLIPAEEAPRAFAPSLPAAAAAPIHTPSSWRMSIDAASDGERARVELGADAAARDGYDVLDAFTPPPPPGQSLSLALMDGADGDRMLRDVRRTQSDDLVWVLQVDGDAPVQLTWGGIDAAVGTVTIEHEGRRHDLGSLQSLEVPGGRQELRIVASSSASPGVPTRLVAVTPNPFKTRATLSYDAPFAGDASIRIYDVSGRLVWQKLQSRVAAGVHGVVWDARDTRGDRVAPGIYFMRVEVGGAGGRFAADQKVTVLR